MIAKPKRPAKARSLAGRLFCRARAVTALKATPRPGPKRLATGALLFAAVLGVSGCAVYRDTDVTMTSQAIDPARYAGVWYEIARFPVAFQKGCTGVTAEYGVIDADTVSVLNTCRDGALDGPVRQIEGSADIVGPGQLRVQFDSVPFIKAPYWVLWVDADYTVAVVGVPSGRAGWILARTPSIAQAELRKAIAVLHANGYDPAKLLNTPQLR
jgi:apolipoprotein D and lipocalin family protein